MRFLGVVSIVAACVAGAALAQDTAPPPVAAADETPQPTPAQLRWVRQPDARAFAHAYPSRAAGQRVPGSAVMCCTILSNGRLDCTVPFEWPRDYGFGEATLRISREWRLDENSAAQYVGGRIRRQIVWLMGSPTQELDDAITRIREGTRNVCGPAMDWSERAPGDIVVTGTLETRPQ